MVQKNLISFGAYVTMFPQLIAGPIVQYKIIDAQLRFCREGMGQFAEGVHRFMIGLGKKVLIANNAGVLWEMVQALGYLEIPVLTAWLGLAAYTFQIYFDFSGYSDMAIGLTRLPALFQHIYYLFFVMLGWNLFVSSDMGQAAGFLKALLGVYGQGFLNRETVYLLYNNAV